MTAPVAVREAFSLLWKDTDDAAIVAVNEVNLAGKFLQPKLIVCSSSFRPSEFIELTVEITAMISES